MRSRNSSPSSWHRTYKVKAEAILCVLWAPVRIFGTHLVENLWQPRITDNLVEKSAWNSWKFTWKFWNGEASSFANFLASTLNRTRSLLTTDGRSTISLVFVKNLFARPSLNILHHCLIVPSVITFWP
jgi:hypothetical protein